MQTNWPVPQGMDEYLRPTRMVDSRSKIVVHTTERLIDGAKTPKEAAISIFQFVRDEIEYMRISLYSKASEVITKRWGNCTNKSTAFVALLRASNIPARMHYFSIKREAVDCCYHPILRPLIPEVIELNGRCDVFLNGKWLTIETEFDPYWYKGLIKKKLINPINLEWNGEQSTHWLDEGVVEDLGVFSCPEKVVDSLMYKHFNWFRRNIYPLGSWLSNRYIEGIRRAGGKRSVSVTTNP